MKQSFTFILMSFLLVTSCNDVAYEKASQIRLIKVIQVAESQTNIERKFPGRAAAANDVTLTFELSGKLNEVLVKVGDRVKSGDVLASIDDRNYQNALSKAKAELKRATAQYERMQKALQEKAVSKQDVTNAEAVWENAKANVEISQKAVDDSQLVAPFDAIISAIYINSFENIVAKQAIIRLIDHSKIEMLGDIPEDVIPMVELGMDILVQFDAIPDIIIPATVSEIGSEASEMTRTFPVTLLMDQPLNASILPGMAGKGWRPADPNNTPASLNGFNVPITAIFSDNNGDQYVWIIEGGTARRQAIQTGDLTSNGILIKGLMGGEYIAIAGVNSLKEGQQVRLMK